MSQGQLTDLSLRHTNPESLTPLHLHPHPVLTSSVSVAPPLLPLTPGQVFTSLWVSFFPAANWTPVQRLPPGHLLIHSHSLPTSSITGAVSHWLLPASAIQTPRQYPAISKAGAHTSTQTHMYTHTHACTMDVDLRSSIFLFQWLPAARWLTCPFRSLAFKVLHSSAFSLSPSPPPPGHKPFCQAQLTCHLWGWLCSAGSHL